MSEKENESSADKIAFEFIDQVWDKKSYTVLDSILADDFRYHTMTREDGEVEGTGTDGLKAALRVLHQDTPGLRVVYDRDKAVTTGDIVTFPVTFGIAEKGTSKVDEKSSGQFTLRVTSDSISGLWTDPSFVDIREQIRETRFDRFAAFMSKAGGALFTFAIFAAVAVATFGSSIPVEVWRGILLGLGALIVVGTTFYLRRRPQFAWATNLIFLAMISVAAILVASVEAQITRVLVLKLVAITFLSLIPGWLYLQFIVVRGKTLREEFVLNLFRLYIDDYGHLPKPPQGSHFYRFWEASGGRERPDNLYMRKFEGVYGVNSRENLLPVVFATVVFAVGWISVIRPEVFFSLPLLDDPAEVSGLPTLPLEALRFGFLGAYFFILQMLVRRYFQDDLKTSGYINAVVRVISVTILVTALAIVWPWEEEQLLAFSFFIGIFPQIGLEAIRKLVAIPLSLLLKSLKMEFPLSDLDGLNIWYESRLLEEGIEDMQNLATANLVDVILRTRVPVERLVDWIDQAHLYLHIPKESRGDFRRLGVRTATNLLEILGPDCERLESDSELSLLAAEMVSTDDGESSSRGSLAVGHERGSQAESEERRVTTETEGREQAGNSFPIASNGGARTELAAIRSLATALDSEPNLYHVRQWKAFVAQLEESRKLIQSSARDNDYRASA